MTFDPAQPTNTTKLRNAPGVIRSNWEAIEQADNTFKPIAINFDNRAALGPVSNNPTAISDAYILYCKEDPAGSPQLYGIDEDSKISQFTSSVVNLAASGGYALLAPGILMQWDTTTYTTPANLTQTVNFPVTYSAVPWVVNTTLKGSPVTGSTPKPFGVTNIVAASFDATMINGGSGAAAFPFNWIAIGPAPV